jgi:anaerobic sulfite reductase subunit B
MGMSALAEAPAEIGALTPRPFRVTSKRRETSDTWTLELEPLAGPPLEAAPGQFAMLYAFGVGEVPISVSGYGTPLVHTVRDVGAVTHAICAAEPGTVLGVRGPYGNAWPLEEAAGGDLVIVAGGIGLAPLHGALLHALAHRGDYHDVVLLYGSRTPGDLLYRDELLSLGGHTDLALEVIVDAAGTGWHGKVGVVPKLVESARFDGAQAVVLVVGPEIMMRYTLQALAARGVARERIYLSMERNMRCGIGQCGHCQLGPTLICRDGPVYSAAEIGALMEVREL